MQNPTLYDAIGGQPAIMAAVDRFYARLIADPALAGFFATTSLQRLKGHQAAFLALALGGPQNCHGRPLREAHAALAISDAHFDGVAAHLDGVLAELGVSDDLRSTILASVGSLRGEIVSAPAQTTSNETTAALAAAGG